MRDFRLLPYNGPFTNIGISANAYMLADSSVVVNLGAGVNNAACP
ncbi:MAG TPA: hypothetical protein VLF91_05040 [Candidatus Saccharimonadales bacterium]|nr:hypothetical protein [Candidatus Saccharimonadales bacterium]